MEGGVASGWRASMNGGSQEKPSGSEVLSFSKSSLSAQKENFFLLFLSSPCGRRSVRRTRWIRALADPLLWFCRQQVSCVLLGLQLLIVSFKWKRHSRHWHTLNISNMFFSLRLRRESLLQLMSWMIWWFSVMSVCSDKSDQSHRMKRDTNLFRSLCFYEKWIRILFMKHLLLLISARCVWGCGTAQSDHTIKTSRTS